MEEHLLYLSIFNELQKEQNTFFEYPIVSFMSIFRSLVCAHSHFIEMYTIRKRIAAFPHYSISFHRGILELRKTVYINKNNMTLFSRYAPFSFVFIFVKMVIKIIL